MVHKMKTLEEVLYDYTRGEKTLEEANKALKELGCGLTLDPTRNLFSARELLETRAGETPDEANGWGILDHGVGSLEKVHVVNGRTVDVDMGQETAYVYMAGKRYRLRGDVLTRRTEMELLTQRLASLLTVKSLVTVILTAVFAAMAGTGRVTAEQFLTVFTVVIAFYFGTQAEKRARE